MARLPAHLAFHQGTCRMYKLRGNGNPASQWMEKVKCDCMLAAVVDESVVSRGAVHLRAAGPAPPGAAQTYSVVVRTLTGKSVRLLGIYGGLDVEMLKEMVSAKCLRECFMYVCVLYMCESSAEFLACV